MSVLSIALAMIPSFHMSKCLSRWLETTLLMHRFEYGRLGTLLGLVVVLKTSSVSRSPFLR